MSTLSMLGLGKTPEDDDEQQQVPMAPTPPSVKDYIAQKYGIADQYRKLAGDNAAVQAAQEQARSTNDAADWGNIFDSTLGGGRGKATFASMRGQAATGVADAQQAHKAKLDTLLMGDKLAREDVTRGQDDQKFANDQEKFGWSRADEAPDSPKAIASRSLLAKQMGVPVASMTGMSYKDQLETAKAFKKAASEGKQLKAVEGPDGKVTWQVFDPASGGLKDTGATVGYKLGYDSPTGTHFSGANPSAAATPVVTTGGKSVADTRTGLEGERAGVKTTATAEAKDVQKVQEAQADATDFDSKSKRWLDLYDSAYKANAAGPGTKLVSDFKNRFGYDSNTAGDQLNAEVKLWANKYIHDTTGAQMSDAEFQNRFAPLLPSRGDNPQLVRTKLSALKQTLSDATNTAKMRVGGAAKQSATGSPTAQAPSKGAPTRKQYNKILDKTRLTYADGTTEDVDGQQ